MPAGRPPKPTTLKHLHGTAQPCRVRDDEPKLTPGKPPRPDALQTEREIEVWDALVEHTLELGVLAPPHGPALGMLTAAYLRWQNAWLCYQRFGPIEKHPKTGLTQRSGYAVELDAAVRDLTRLCGEFGLTPSSQTKVGTIHPKAEKSEREERKGRMFGRSG